MWHDDWLHNGDKVSGGGAGWSERNKETHNPWGDTVFVILLFYELRTAGVRERERERKYKRCSRGKQTTEVLKYKLI